MATSSAMPADRRLDRGSASPSTFREGPFFVSKVSEAQRRRTGVNARTMNFNFIFARVRHLVLDADRCSSPWLLPPLRRILDHDAMGGHTLSLHVGLSYNDLASRLSASTNISAASSFWSVHAAHASACFLTMANLDQFSNWLQGSVNRTTLRTPVPVRAPIGYSLLRGNRQLTMCREAVMVLEKLPSTTDVFYIVTIYPV